VFEIIASGFSLAFVEHVLMGHILHGCLENRRITLVEHPELRLKLFSDRQSFVEETVARNVAFSLSSYSTVPSVERRVALSVF
jgi:hypothetical protein